MSAYRWAATASGAVAHRAREPVPGKVRRVRALVTGARGFVGSWLTAHLVDSGDEVVAIDHEVEITDGEAVRAAVVEAAPDVVYHLAALTSVGGSWADPSEVLRVNAIGTLYVLEAARSCARPPRVLVTSSAEVYGAVPPELAAGDRGRPARPGHALRRVARWRPSTSGSRPISPTGCRSCACARSTTWARASRRPSSSPRWPSGSSRPGATGPEHHGGQPDGPA